MEPGVHYSLHMRPSPIPILVQINPIHALIPLIEINFNIILPSRLRSSKWSVSIRSPHQYPLQYLLHVPPISLPAEEHETNMANSLSSFYYHENPKICGKNVLGIKHNVPSQHFSLRSAFRELRATCGPGGRI